MGQPQSWAFSCDVQGVEMKLLPCPFCGDDEPEFEREGTGRVSCIVVCTNCGCRHQSSDSGEHNGSSWNRRHGDGANGALGERAAVVAWLRHPLQGPAGLGGVLWGGGYANCIERGDHKGCAECGAKPCPDCSRCPNCEYHRDRCPNSTDEDKTRGGHHKVRSEDGTE